MGEYHRLMRSLLLIVTCPASQRMSHGFKSHTVCIFFDIFLFGLSCLYLIRTASYSYLPQTQHEGTTGEVGTLVSGHHLTRTNKQRVGESSSECTDEGERRRWFRVTYIIWIVTPFSPINTFFENVDIKIEIRTSSAWVI